MDLLHALAAEAAEQGTVVVADEQTGGRGSRGRAWRSPRGGLWLSLLFRPPSSVGVELLGLRAGLAVAAVVERLGPGLSVGIKWPNDLMMDDRKLGGILCEARWQGEALAWIVVGIGLNVANRIPHELAGTAMALADRVPGVTPERLEPDVTAALRVIDASSGSLAPAELDDLRRRDWLFGRRLRAPAEGTAAGIAEDGSLLIRPDRGESVPVRAGTVELADRRPLP